MIDITIAPLRERCEDLPALCQALLARIADESGLSAPPLSAQALAELAAHPLMGNVRELENLLYRAVALSEGDELHLDAPQSSTSASMPLAPTPDRPDDVELPTDLQSHLDQQEREILVKTLKDTGFNRTVAAHRLGLSLRQIRYRIARLKIDMPASRDDGHYE